MITGAIFFALAAVGFALALLGSPFWALPVYANVYFNAPLFEFTHVRNFRLDYSRAFPSHPPHTTRIYLCRIDSAAEFDFH